MASSMRGVESLMCGWQLCYACQLYVAGRWRAALKAETGPWKRLSLIRLFLLTSTCRQMSMVASALQVTHSSFHKSRAATPPFPGKGCFLEAARSERLMSWSPACEGPIDAVFGSAGAEARGCAGLPAYNQVMLDIAAQSECGGRSAAERGGARRREEARPQWVAGWMAPGTKTSREKQTQSPAGDPGSCASCNFRY